jgi:hypothetical protein
MATASGAITEAGPTHTFHPLLSQLPSTHTKWKLWQWPEVFCSPPITSHLGIWLLPLLSGPAPRGLRASFVQLCIVNHTFSLPMSMTHSPSGGGAC